MLGSGNACRVLPRAIYTAAVTFGKELLVSDIRCSAWADQRVLDACSALTTAEIERDLRISHSSILRTLGHIYDGERVWLDCLRTTVDGGMAASTGPSAGLFT
jgi:uncharacterized damage-inducible protein DinB